MQPAIPSQMKAAAIDRFGGPEVLHTETLEVPRPGPRQVLVRLDFAGIGVWDPYVRTGEVELGPRRFPRIIGNDGAGEVVAVGEGVQRRRPGARVLAVASGQDGVALARLNQLIGAGPFHVELDRVYALDEAARAHREIGQHHLGKLALRIH